VTISLPDINVWIALVAEGHIHHIEARAWFEAQQDSSVAFCRITQMGFLRLLTNQFAMGRSPRTVAEAWAIFTRLRGDRRVVFAGEPDGIEEEWEELMKRPGVGASSWTDAYLAALARRHSYTLVTFDKGMAAWADLKRVLLTVR
jgi:toxin-antitoxin system PIN domain toxin